jgi:hypothetical protein
MNGPDFWRGFSTGGWTIGLVLFVGWFLFQCGRWSR